MSWFLLLLLIAGADPQQLHAQTACEPVVGAVVSREGRVEVERAGTFRWQPAALGQSLCEGDSVRAGQNSRAALRLINDAVLRLDQNTTVQLSEITAEPQERSFLDLVRGVIQSFSRQPRLLAINTPYLNATVEGTEFLAAASDEESAITVLEGVVRAANPQGEVRVGAGEAAVALAGQAPVQRLVVRPRDAVQWAIYYPPVLRAGEPSPDAPLAVGEALERYQDGDVDGALTLLDTVPAAARDASWHLYRGALLLSVGRLAQAQGAIDRARAEDPDSARAQALQAVIASALDDRDAALAAGQRAVELDPSIAASWIALSYAQQARFDLEGARESLLKATEVAPEDGLAFARLAELRLASGDRRGARAAAERATELAPGLARTETVLGFASLAEIDTATARAAFERAIAADSADPLPRLGLGLAKIRDGALEEGREELEIAAALDPNNALLRAYLGKAYFEEKRSPLDARQFALAKQLDPLDPTAFLYDAIRLQTENQPVKALRQVEKSIELNDNRAVYRSRLQLDSDRAARGASLARIYDNLGFQELGVLEASRSLSADPGNPAAHRFLSDTYRGVRRREFARVSELLQAQLLQDININPVQPSLSEVNLNLNGRGGPTETGFNEFTPLFERDQVQVAGSGLVGSDNTIGGEAVVSGIYDRFSLSAGAFGYGTDGWRVNHDIDHTIFNVFAQAALTPQLNAQVELRQRETRQGDLAFNFDPDAFSPNAELRLDEDIARAGLRWSPRPSSDLLLSVVYADGTETQSDSFDTPSGLFVGSGDTTDEGFTTEGQFIQRGDRLNVIVGGALSDFQRDITASETLGGAPLFDFSREEDIDHRRGYLYGNVNFPASIDWTLGFSYDDYEQEELQLSEFNPKFGVQWAVTEDLVVRGAIFQVVKPFLASSRTLEPTQVAGFNQFFDDATGDKALRYGVGLDWHPLRDLYVGGEATWRDLDLAVISISEGRALFFDANEQTHRVYVDWTPWDELVVSAEVVYDLFDAPRSDFTAREPIPEEAQTISVPLSLGYFHPSGFFGGVTGTFVDQRVERDPRNLFGLPEGDDEFFVLDVGAGFRFPKRLGVATLQINNILNSDFSYQDDSYREFQDRPSIGPYIPDPQITARITLNW